MCLYRDSTDWQKILLAALLKLFEIPENNLPNVVTIQQSSDLSVASFGSPTNGGESHRVYPNSSFLHHLDVQSDVCTVANDGNDKLATDTAGSIDNWNGCVIALDHLEAGCLQNAFILCKIVQDDREYVSISIYGVGWDEQIVDETPVKKLLEE